MTPLTSPPLPTPALAPAPRPRSPPPLSPPPSLDHCPCPALHASDHAAAVLTFNKMNQRTNPPATRQAARIAEFEAAALVLKQGMATSKDKGKKGGDADDESSDGEGEDGEGGVGSAAGGRRRWGRRRKYKPGEYGPELEHVVAVQRIQRWLRRRWTMERFKVCHSPSACLKAKSLARATN